MTPKTTENQSSRTFHTRQQQCFRNYPLTVFSLFVLLVLSLAPIGAPEAAGDVPFFDKWVHFVMYGTLALIIWWERRRNGKGLVPVLPQLLFGVLFPILFSGLMEVCQACFTTYRSGEWLDFLANSVGVCIGSAFAWLFSR